MNYQLAFISGATSGLGKELSILLAKKKIPLFLTGRDLDILTKLQKELQEKTSVYILPADLSNPLELEKLINALKQQGPDLIINAAGIGFYGNVLSSELENQMLMLKVNIDATTAITITAAKALKKQNKPGTIMNISSAAASYTYPSFAVYAASKRFIKEFSLSLDYELSKHQIRVLSCLPGRFHSNFKQRASGIPNVNSWDTMSLGKTAQKILKQIEKKRKVSTIDFRYKMLRFFSLFIPTPLLANLLQKNIPKKY